MNVLSPGQRFDRYQIEQLLGRGGMGQVFRAYDTHLRRRVALKILRPDRSTAALGEPGDETQEAGATRLLREARAAAALKHPNLVAIYDAAEADGMPFIVMELAEGKSLRAYVGDSSVPLGRRVGWLADVARALGAAHASGLVHRDVKPDNVIVCVDGAAKVLDFGIAKSTHSEGPPPSVGPLPTESVAGHVIGTPKYMAPEQLRGEAVDGRADQYAWGLTAYELVAGLYPQSSKPGGGLPQLGPPPRLLSEVAPDVPFELAAVVMKTLAPRPELRFESMEDVARAVAPFASETSTAATASSPSPAPAPTPGPMAKASVTERDAPAAGNDPTLRADSADAAALATLATRQERPVGVHETLESPPPASTSEFDARLLDPNGTPRAHLLIPGAPFLAFLAAVGCTAAFWHTPRARLVVPFDVLALVAIFLSPLARPARVSRYARVVVAPKVLRVERAGLSSQTLRSEDITGASLAPTPQGHSLVLARRGRKEPLRVELGEAAHADAVRRALDLPDAVQGSVRWPTGPGVVEWIGAALATAWRLSLMAGVLCGALQLALPGTVLLLSATGLGLLSGLAWLFAPRSGPSLTLSASEVRVTGRGGDRRLACADVAAARATEGGVSIESVGQAVVLVPARGGSFLRRGLSDEDCVHVAAHVREAAQRARRVTR